MQLTAENYYSEEANFEHMSVSQFKDFVGTYGRRGCEFTAMDKIRGVYKEEETTALLVGSYVDAYFEGTLDKFKAEHPDIFKKTGDKGLKSDYVQANDIIARIERDEFFMAHMSGQKQVIMAGELFGLPWKIKIDSYLEGIAIVDLKVMASLTKLEWVRDIGYLDFVRYWGYDIQGAVYQEIVYQNTGKRLPFYRRSQQGKGTEYQGYSRSGQLSQGGYERGRAQYREGKTGEIRRSSSGPVRVLRPL